MYMYIYVYVFVYIVFSVFYHGFLCITKECWLALGALQAINANSAKMIQRAIACAPRGERANWMLVVQVGALSGQSCQCTGVFSRIHYIDNSSINYFM